MLLGNDVVRRLCIEQCHCPASAMASVILSTALFGVAVSVAPDADASSAMVIGVVVVVHHTSLTCVAPSGTGVGAGIVVTVAGLMGVHAATFAYSSPIVATVRLPASNPMLGGATITLEGANFGAVKTKLNITVGSTACLAGFVCHTSVSCVIAAGVGKQLDVSIDVDALAGTLASSYFYDPPTVTSVSPGTGPTAGGLAVIIRGTKFGDRALSSSRTAEIGGFVCVKFRFMDGQLGYMQR